MRIEYKYEVPSSKNDSSRITSKEQLKIYFLIFNIKKMHLLLNENCGNTEQNLRRRT